MYLKKPDIIYLRVINNKSWVLIPKILRGSKFRSRFIIYRLLNYKGSNQYILQELERDIIIYARDVIINEWNKTYEAIQKEIKENPDNDNLKLIYDNEINLKESLEIQIQKSDQININNILDNLVGDVKGERDNQIYNFNYKKVI